MYSLPNDDDDYDDNKFDQPVDDDYSQHDDDQ